jgi:hypothetical protein
MAKVARAAQTVSVACKLPQGLHIHLTGHPHIIKLHGSHSPYAIAGHGITAGVSADVWEAVKVQYADAAWLKNGFVFANGAPQDTADEAEERQGVKSGFEPIDPAAPGGPGALSGIESA